MVSDPIRKGKMDQILARGHLKETVTAIKNTKANIDNDFFKIVARFSWLH